MRIRTFVLAALLAVGVVAATPTGAFAADHNEEVFECVEKAIDDNTTKGGEVDFAAFKNALDDCNKAKSLVSPATPEILWGGIAFLIVLAVLMKFAFPALKQGLKDREEKIRDELESAANAREEAEAEASQYRAQIGDARSEASVIIEDARADAERIRREVVARAETEAAEVRQRAQEDIRLAQERAVSDLRAQVADMSIELAEKVVERNLDRDTQIALIESYINSVGNETAVTPASSKTDAYAQAILEIARAEGLVQAAEDDLFRFARALEGSEPLRVALTDPQLPVERRLAVVDELTGGKALPLSASLLGLLIGAGRVNDLGEIVDRFVELAAAERRREVAEVRSAVELDADQIARLSEALGRATGKSVEVKVTVDPSLLGGLVTKIGDTVIDGSVRHRLEQMKAQL